MNFCEAQPTVDVVRVLVVDDHVGFLHAVMSVVDATPGFELVGTATSGQEALELLDRDRSIDLVLLDVRMQPVDGIEVARRYHAGSGTAAVVLMSTTALDDLSDLVRHPSVAGFLPKESLSTDSLTQLWASIQSH